MYQELCNRHKLSNSGLWFSSATERTSLTHISCHNLIISLPGFWSAVSNVLLKLDAVDSNSTCCLYQFSMTFQQHEFDQHINNRVMTPLRVFLWTEMQISFTHFEWLSSCSVLITVTLPSMNLDTSCTGISHSKDLQLLRECNSHGFSDGSLTVIALRFTDGKWWNLQSPSD